LFELLIGKINSLKINHIKNDLIPALKTPIIVLDFKGEYQDLEGFKSFDLGEIDPLSRPMNFEDAVVINSAVLKYSKYLENSAEEVLKFIYKDEWATKSYDFLISDSIDRSLNRWNQNENSYIIEARKYLQFNKSKQIYPILEVFEQMKNEPKIILESNGLHSTESRVILFCLLHLFQKENIHFTLVSDNLNFTWLDGYLTNFIRVFDFSKIDAIFAFNKTSVIPKKIIPLVDRYKIFRLDSNNDFSLLKNQLKLPVASNTKSCKPGIFQTINITEKAKEEQTKKPLLT
jgi:hypothetical protein